MQQYKDLLVDILENGTYKMDRTGTGCTSVFGRQMRFDLRESFPLPTVCHTPPKGLIAELIWILEGSTSARRLNELGARIWDEWCLDNGDLGPVYGSQWVTWEAFDKVSISNQVNDIKDALEDGASKEDIFSMLQSLDQDVMNPAKVNQIQEVITSLKENPNSRRHIVSAWNVADLPREYIWQTLSIEQDEILDSDIPITEEESKQLREPIRRALLEMGREFTEETIDNMVNFVTHKRKIPLTPQDNVGHGKMALPPCHLLFQFHARELSFDDRRELALQKGFDIETTDHPRTVEESHKVFDTLNIPRHGLSCQLYQRSCDAPIGLRWNIASYALLTCMVAQCVNMVPEEFVWTGGDIHIYSNQMEQVKEMLGRETMNPPKLWLNPEIKDIFSFTTDDIRIEEYSYWPAIKFDIAV